MAQPPAPVEHCVTSDDLAKLLAGEGGVDLVPVVEGGRQVAMRVVGVAPGTTAARLGAQNGDTIESINGERLTSVAAAYAIGDRAVRARRIEIRGKRGASDYATVLVLGS